MIVGSPLLILGAVVMLALGLVRGSTAYLVGSIAASLLAAIVLVAGSRRGRPVQVLAGDEAVLAGGEAAREREEPVARRATVAVREPMIPVQGGSPDQDREPAGEGMLDEDSPDEPIAQQVSPADAARVARMSNEVRVIDGRPRYHLPSCPRLAGRDSEPLPVHEAIELGFTPCGQCEPDSPLPADQGETDTV